MKPHTLAKVQAVRIDPKVIASTLATLRAYGSRRLEGLVLWLGTIDGIEAHVTHALEPEQHSIADENGVGYFVDSETLFRLNKALAATGLRLIAQIHSHPTDAYHSEADDRYAIVTSEGGFSLVVPNFGQAPADPTAWAAYRLEKGVWTELSKSFLDAAFQVA
jgi:Prokaryotic homologs of the JAB domain